MEHKKLVLFHGVKKLEDVDSIMKNGFDLSKIKPLWQNDYAVSTLTTWKSVKRYFGDKQAAILRIEFDGTVASHDEVSIGWVRDAKDYTDKVIKQGIDAVMLGGEGARQVFIYNVEAIKRITKL